MAKRLATSHQLQRLIYDRMRGVTVFIQQDPNYGWVANLIASPAQVTALNAELQQVVDELREQYDLSE
jgi:hypothetical protein